jgi:feruloyl esterase
MAQLWTAHATLIDAGAALSAADFALVNSAVLAQCDARDRVEDGVLTDPTACNFNPRDLVCRGSATDTCLAEPKVTALEKIYAGPSNPRTGVSLYPGLEPGSETGWGLIMNGRTPFFIDIPVLGGMGFENDNWDWRTFDYDRDVRLIDAKLAHVLNAVDPDLRDFEANGGKLIIYHGWNDPGVMPQRTIDYYNEIIAFSDRAQNGNGSAFVEDFARLFMMPGVGHCSGGPGPDQADFMSALVGWVESDKAPEQIIASTPDGSVTRPLCPHPLVAVYDSGDSDEAGSFTCR